MTSKNMRVNARLDSDRASKFNYIRQRTNQGASDHYESGDRSLL
ncbi:MAG: hypothetical protein ACKPEO_25820 [Sphaerospermopsis kisseleviana]